MKKLSDARRVRIAKLLEAIGYGYGAIQAFIVTINNTTPPLITPQSIVIVTGIIGMLSAINTTWYQFLTKAIPNKVAYMTGLVAVILSTLGAINEIFSILPINKTTSTWLTLAISGVSIVIQVVSKAYYVPSEKK